MEPILKSVVVGDQLTLPYVEQGDPSSVSVLFLHGLTGSAHSWRPVLAHLPASIHAIAPTQRGHGDASKPETGYTMRHLADDAAAFMDAMGLEKAIVVGHSMGTDVAQILAWDHPDQVLGLVLLGAEVVGPADAYMRDLWESSISKLEDPIDPDFTLHWVQAVLSRPVPEASLQSALEQVRKVPARVWKGIWRAFLEQEDRSGDLGQIRAPTLILWGDQDAITPRSQQEALLAGIPNARLVIYEGVGHGIHREAPERVAAAITAFAQEVAP